MEQAANWIAPIATTIAACMTAANLGPRLTGWGFVVFAIGAVAWAAIGLWTGQGNLVWQNAILLGIDLIGIWRWLGREARYATVAQAGEQASRAESRSELISTTRLSDAAVAGPRGEAIGRSVDAMAACEDGKIAYVVIREGGVGGIGETLHAVPWSRIRTSEEGLVLTLDAAGLRRLPALSADDASSGQRLPH